MKFTEDECLIVFNYEPDLENRQTAYVVLYVICEIRSEMVMMVLICPSLILQ